MKLLDRFHAFLTETLGVSPKVADAVVAGLVAVAVNWVTTGSFDVGELKLLGLTLLFGLVGYAAPIATGLTRNRKAVSVHMRHVLEDSKTPEGARSARARRRAP